MDLECFVSREACLLLLAAATVRGNSCGDKNRDTKCRGKEREKGMACEREPLLVEGRETELDFFSLLLLFSSSSTFLYCLKREQTGSPLAITTFFLLANERAKLGSGLADQWKVVGVVKRDGLSSLG